MSEVVDAGLSLPERLMLCVLSVVVPEHDRSDWRRTWQAELWHLHHHRSNNLRTRSTPYLACGLIFDALWLRTDSWRRALQGTATLCLLELAGACLCAVLVGLVVMSDFHSFGTQVYLSLVEAPLVVFVSFATASRRHIHDGGTLRPIHRLRRQLFFVLKAGLVLTLGFLVSADLAQPMHHAFPLLSDLFQTLMSVVFSITGLRWAMLDQQERCKHCLLALASPSRVGRPSYNLLEWNGTEQICRRGHGMLSSPEMETSWCSHSRWLNQIPEQQQPA